MSDARPFVKWAGGKNLLVGQLFDLFPKVIGNYYEPFLGGGAVFFKLMLSGRVTGRAVLNDWNSELIDTYKVIRDFPDELISKLKLIPNDKDTFLKVRAVDPASLDPVLRAARMIYLNRTCFNGLYRVNKAGRFNSPFADYKNPTICDEPNLRAVSTTLNRHAALLSGDFTDAVKDAKAGDLVYFDPPYVPLNATSNFTAYTGDGFGIDDHHRLALTFKGLVDRGVSVVLSNSDTEIVRALYEGFELNQIMAKRNINSKGDGRGPVAELIIVGRRSETCVDSTCSAT